MALTPTTEEKELDLRQYFYNFVRWWWLLILGAVGGGLLVYFLTTGGPTVYEASAKLLVQGSDNPGIASVNDPLVTESLALNYRELIKTRHVMELVSERLSSPRPPSSLSGAVKIGTTGNVITITASDEDPVMAANLANITARVVVDDFRDRQLAQIASFQSALRQYGIDLDPTVSVAQATMLNLFSVLEEALPPSSPTASSTLRNVLMGGLLGFVVAGLIVLVIGYLDDRIKSPEDLGASTGLNVMGSVPEFKFRKGARRINLIDEPADGEMAQAYGFLRTNLGFASLGTSDVKSLLVTSAGPEEGKSTTVANLGVALAREGKTTVIVDLDFRRPSLHKLFDLKSDIGFCNVLWGNLTMEQALQPTSVPQLALLSTGPLPPDVTSALRSPMLSELIAQLRESSDMVLVDSPPLLVVPDPMILAPFIDAILMVVDMGQSGREKVSHAAEMIHRANPAVSGVVLNKVARRRGSYYYYQYAYDYPYSDNHADLSHSTQNGRVLSKVLKVPGKLRKYARLR